MTFSSSCASSTTFSSSYVGSTKFSSSCPCYPLFGSYSRSACIARWCLGCPSFSRRICCCSRGCGPPGDHDVLKFLFHDVLKSLSQYLDVLKFLSWFHNVLKFLFLTAAALRPSMSVEVIKVDPPRLLRSSSAVLIEGLPSSLQCNPSAVIQPKTSGSTSPWRTSGFLLSHNLL